MADQPGLSLCCFHGLLGQPWKLQSVSEGSRGDCNHMNPSHSLSSQRENTSGQKTFLLGSLVLVEKDLINFLSLHPIFQLTPLLHCTLLLPPVLFLTTEYQESLVGCFWQEIRWRERLRKHCLLLLLIASVVAFCANIRRVPRRLTGLHIMGNSAGRQQNKEKVVLSQPFYTSVVCFLKYRA